MIICYHDNWEIVLVKNKYISIIWGKKNLLLTLDNYLLSCGGSNGRVSGSGSGSGSSCGGCDCCLL